MMSKPLFLIIMVLLLTACSGKTIYLFNSGYSQNSINEVTEQLVLLGYDIKSIGAAIPLEFGNTAIATHPVFPRPDDLVSIEQTLKRLKFPTPHFYRFAQGNHFYKSGNIGLYLRKETQNTALVQLMPPVMGSVQCSTETAGEISDASLEFFRSGEVKLEIETYIDDEYVEGSQVGYKGGYTLKNDTVELTFTDFSTNLLPLNTTFVDTFMGKKQAIQIIFRSLTKDTLIEDCLFEAIYD